MNKLNIFKYKLVNFIIQISILSLFIYIFEYEYTINFDKGISKERQVIIQFLANYIMFNANDSFGISFIYFSWFIACLIPILSFNDYKKAYSLNLTTFFFPNFFFYVFLFRYSPNYYDSHFQIFITQTIIQGIFIVLTSIGLSLFLMKIRKLSNKTQLENLRLIEKKNTITCPNCGTQFNSIPQYCYNCLKELTTENYIDD